MNNRSLVSEHRDFPELCYCFEETHCMRLDISLHRFIIAKMYSKTYENCDGMKLIHSYL